MDAGDTLLLQMEIPRRPRAAALSAARARSVNQHPQHLRRSSDAVGRLAPQSDIVIANETEFRSAVGRQGANIIRSTHGTRGRTAARAHRLGPVQDPVNACRAMKRAPGRRNRRDRSCRSRSGSTRVDTVGAGDTFCGYLAQGLDSRDVVYPHAIRPRRGGRRVSPRLKPGAQSRSAVWQKWMPGLLKPAQPAQVNRSGKAVRIDAVHPQMAFSG